MKTIRYLIEDIEAVKKNYPKIEDETFYKLIALDPTYNEKRNSVGTYGKWILNLYNKGKLKEEDFYKVTDYLNQFEQKKKGFKNKDIGQFKTLPDLAKALDDVGDVELTHAQQVRQNQKERKNADLGKEASLVCEGDLFNVWVPHTYAASCKLGQGTHWCTASTESDNYYNSYLDNYGGEYYILQDKNGKPLYQFHFESNQFMDEYDSPVNPFSVIETDEKVKKFFEPKIKEHFNLPADINMDEEYEFNLDVKEVLNTYDIENYNNRDTVSGENVEVVLDGEAYEWFDDMGYNYSWSDMINYPPTLNESNEQRLSELGLDVENYPECLEDTPYQEVYERAWSNSFNQTAEQECYNDVIRWLKNNGLVFAYEDDNKVFKTKTTPNKVITDYLDFTDEESNSFDGMLATVKGYELSQNSLYEPRYGWGGGVDDDIFNDNLSDELAEIEYELTKDESLTESLNRKFKVEEDYWDNKKYYVTDDDTDIDINDYIYQEEL